MIQSSGTAAGERQLLGPQTTGRTYQNLSQPTFAARAEANVAVAMRDGVHLHLDVHRPAAEGRFPALLAVSPYPRQVQNLGLPIGFVEAGQTDFWVPRGYAHVIANSRGTSGSEGTYGFFSAAERGDLYDLIEWIAAQPWCDGNVGMIGVSYFAIEQFHAALEAPPHLRAIFPWSGTLDMYREVLWHGGMPVSRFMAMYLHGIGAANRQKEDFFRGPLFQALEWLVKRPFIHRRFEKPAHDTLAAFNNAMAIGYDPHPWDDLYFQMLVEHPLYDDFWRARDLTTRLAEVRIPMYLGADWDNVPMHLDSPFLAWDHLPSGAQVRVGITPRGGLSWPWESMHVEALAWYDHWLKGRDTGILDGPPIRYFVEGADEWRAADTWPLPGTDFRSLHLRADGRLGAEPGPEGARDYLHLPAAVERPGNSNPPTLPARLAWDTEPFREPIELAGPLVLHLVAASTATDADWIVKLSDVTEDGTARALTQGWLRASHRAKDPARSQPHRPHHPHDRAEPLVPGQATAFEIAVLPMAQRFEPGHRLRLEITSHDGDGFAMQGLSHAPLSLPARQRIFSDSRLVLPFVLGG